MAWVRDATRRADNNTEPRSVDTKHIILAAFDRVVHANNRKVLAETETIQANKEWNEARYALSRLVADYGVEGLVDGHKPPPVRDNDD